MAIDDQAEAEWREEFALRLRALMILHDLRTSEIARGIGISDGRFANWLQAIGIPPAYYLNLLQKRFGICLDYLVSGDVKSLDLVNKDFATALVRGPRALIAKRRPELLKKHEPRQSSSATVASNDASNPIVCA